jgi:3-oxoacyl-[acyl-carrier-protein] synthase III
MGVIIKASGVSVVSQDSSIENAVQAARNCLEKAGIDGSQVDLLINVGIYRDDNIMEPSIAALIQQRLELNPDPVKADMQARTFSFDLMNGACGFLSAVEVSRSLLQTGVYRNVLVVGGDVHPSRRAAPGFPFASVGGAVLLGNVADDTQGFGAVQAHSRTENEYFGYFGQGAMEDFGVSGRQFAPIVVQPQFALHFSQCLSESVQNFLRRESLRPDQIDVLVTSPIEAGFPAQLAANIGLPASTHVIDIHPELGDPHTAAPMVCVNELMQRGAWQPGARILFALVGSGITTTCALYRVPT